MAENRLLIEQNIQLLKTLHGLIEQLSPQEYIATDDPCYKSPIGAHVRHILDHYFMFLAGLKSGRIDYDQRERDPELETDPRAAQTAIRTISEQLISTPPAENKILVEQAVQVDGENPAQESTIGRELTFLHSHTVHHHSIVVMIMHLMGKQPPKEAGYAPSTLKYMKEQACAR